MGFGLVLIVLFAWHALRASHPLIDLRLLQRRPFTTAAAVMSLVGFAMFGLVLLVPLYLQQARGFTAVHAGLLALPQGLSMAIALVGSGRLTARRSPRLLVLTGILLTLAGLGILSQVTAHTSQWLLAGAGLVVGLGLGATTVPATTTCYRGMAHKVIPEATSAIRVFQQLGGVVGSATLAVILQHALVAGGRPTPSASSSAFASTFLWALVITGFAIIPAALLPTTPPSEPRRPGETAATPP